MAQPPSAVPDRVVSDRQDLTALFAIAMKCLHKGRAHRYRSVLDLKRDLALFLEGGSVSASPDTFSQAVVKLIKRNKGISASVAGAAFVLIAVTSFFLINLTRQRHEAVRARGIADKLAEVHGAPVNPRFAVEKGAIAGVVVMGKTVRSLEPLRGMPLVWVDCEESRVSDLRPLEGMKLELLCSTPKNIKRGIEIVRAMKTIREIGDDYGRRLKPEEFWRKHDAGEFK